MTNNRMNPDRMMVYRERIYALGDQYSSVQNKVNLLINSYGGHDTTGSAGELQRMMPNTKEKLVAVGDAIRVLTEAWAENEKKAQGNISSAYSVDEKNWGYAENIVTGTGSSDDTPYSYRKYESYRNVKDGFDFSGYDDIAGYTFDFLNSSWANVLAAKDLGNFRLMLSEFLSHVSALEHIFDPNAYTDSLMEDALGSVLNSLPEVPEGGYEVPGWLKQIVDLLSKTGGDWAKAWAQVYGEDGQKTGMYSETETDLAVMALRELVDSLPEDKVRGFNQIVTILNGVNPGSIMKHWDRITRLFADYSAQLDYLDAIQSSFEREGRWGGNIQSVVEELRNKYESSLYTFVSEHADKLLGELEATAEETLLSSCPSLTGAFIALHGVSEATQTIFHEQIDAAYSLYGSIQYDQALVRSFSGYADLIQKNLATDKEIQEAERLYQVIKSTKISEYKNAIVLEQWKIGQGGGSPEKLTMLETKLEELQSLDTWTAPKKTKQPDTDGPNWC